MIDDKIQALNARLKAAIARVEIRRRNDRLYLRATLPPKPGSPRTDNHQQEIALGVYANAGGLKAAKEEAMVVSAAVSSKQFDWNKYLSPKKIKQTVSDWVKAFEADYFQRRERNPKSETTWRKDYREPFNKLPSDKPLTTETMLIIIATTKPDTKTRKRFCAAYGSLARFAGVELDTKKLRGKYSPRMVDERMLPSDELIAEWRDRIPNPGWKWVYSMVAAYGLRPHECFYVERESVQKTPLVRILDGKTGYHPALPVLPEWWEEWRLADMQLPSVTASCNRDYGLRASQYFKRLGLPFRLYDVRHAWAARAARMGLPDTIAAKLQGHSLQMHNQVYQRFMDDRHFLSAWESMIDRANLDYSRGLKNL